MVDSPIKPTKLAIIGAGAVGSTLAFAAAQRGVAREIVLEDIAKERVEAEVLDMQHGSSFYPTVTIDGSDDPEICRDADMVVITAGPRQKPGQSRLELVGATINILKAIIPGLVKVAPNALYIIVSNPCDVMTYAFAKLSGLPENQILGSGTALDTARLRCRLSQHYGVSEKNIHAYVFGEHGDTSFVPWSRAFVAGATLDEFDKIVHEDQKDLQPLDREEVLEYVHTSGSTVIAKKGATFYAVAVSVCRLCSLLLAASDTIVSVSTMLHGEYGVEDVCLSTMASIGPEGVKRIVRVPLTEEETEKLHASANALKDVIAQIDL